MKTDSMVETVETAETVGKEEPKKEYLGIEDYFFCSHLDKKMRDELKGEEIEGKTILDLGCGQYADFACRYSKENANYCVALDKSVEIMNALSNRLRRMGNTEDVHGVIADACHLPFRENVFDRIYASFSLLYVDGEEMKRVGKEAVVATNIKYNNVFSRMVSELGLGEEKIIRKDYLSKADKNLGVFYARLNLR